MTEVTEATTDQAILDVSRLEGLEGFDEVASLLGDRGHASIGNLWGSAQGLVLASLARREDVAGAMRMVVVSTEAEAEAFADDLEAFGVRTLRFPARERGARGASDDARSARARIQVVSEFTAGLTNVPFGYSNKFNHFDLLILDIAVLRLELVELLDKHVNFISVLCNFV